MVGARRNRWGSMAVALVGLLGACGVGEGDRALPATTAVPVDDDRTTATTTEPEGDDEDDETTTTERDPGPVGEGPSWDEVLAVVGSDHGTIERTIGIVDDSTSEPLGPMVTVEMRFDAVQELLNATVAVPEVGSSGGGTLEIVYGREEIYLRIPIDDPECDGWIPMGEAAEGLTGLDLESMVGFPPAPFDRLPEDVAVHSNLPTSTAFDIEIPATLMVASSVQQEYPEVWDRLLELEVPASLTASAAGWVSIAATIPAADVLPEEEVGGLPNLDDYVMEAAWELEASDGPLGLEVPTDLSPESCLN